MNMIFFILGVFNPKDVKISFRFLAKKRRKISPNSRIPLHWPRGDERSKMLLEVCNSAHITIIKKDT